MVKFKFDDDAYIIENSFLYAFKQPNKKYINLDVNAGDDMNYEQSDFNIINYPGEYDIDGKRIICLLGNDNKLNYLLFVNGKKIGIIQSPEILESDEVEDMESRLYTNVSVEKKIDQLELEGEKVKLEEEIPSQQAKENTPQQTQETIS